MSGNGPVHELAEPHDSRLGLYLHIPFCEKKCPYCDFNTYAGLDAQHQETVDALCRELEQWSEPLQQRPLHSIFIGGGTPTVLTANQLEQLLTTVQRSFRLDTACEITSEANPGAVDRDKFAALRSLGVNRLSLGVQSFQPDELRFLGRIHDVDDVFRAVDGARAVGFDNINLDFMFGLPHQSVASWQATLEQALALAPDHLSLYSLIVEPNTPLHHWVATGQVDTPDDDLAADHYELAMSALSAAGYWQYEVSNWARRQSVEPDSLMPALASRHNLLYWRNAEYLGIGPGAHSHIRQRRADGEWIGRRWANRKSVPGYVKRMRQGHSVEDFHEEVSGALAMGETMMLGLRLLDEGVAFNRFGALHGSDLRTVFAAEIAGLQEKGLLRQDEERVRLTQFGLMLGNQVFSRFVAEADKQG